MCVFMHACLYACVLHTHLRSRTPAWDTLRSRTPALRCAARRRWLGAGAGTPGRMARTAGPMEPCVAAMSHTSSHEKGLLSCTARSCTRDYLCHHCGCHRVRGIRVRGTHHEHGCPWIPTGLPSQRPNRRLPEGLHPLHGEDGQRPSRPPAPTGQRASALRISPDGPMHNATRMRLRRPCERAGPMPATFQLQRRRRPYRRN